MEEKLWPSPFLHASLTVCFLVKFSGLNHFTGAAKARLVKLDSHMHLKEESLVTYMYIRTATSVKIPSYCASSKDLV